MIVHEGRRSKTGVLLRCMAPAVRGDEMDNSLAVDGPGFQFDQ